jgi:hypothetical protein
VIITASEAEFSGVEKASAVVIRSAPLSSGLPPVLALVTVTVMVFSVVWGIQSTMVFSVGGADQDKFTLGGNKRSLVVVDATGAVILSGNTLTFAATDFEARSDHVYSVIITATTSLLASLLVVRLITMFGLFSGVEKASAVVIRSAPLSSGLPPVLALVTVTVYQHFVLPRLMFLRLKTQTR